MLCFFKGLLVIKTKKAKNILILLLKILMWKNFYGFCFFNLKIISVVKSNSFNNEANCRWPVSDTLFVIDSTVNVGTNENHALFLEFAAQVSQHIVNRNMRNSASKTKNGISTLAVVQFTPEAKFEFGFGQHEEGLERVQKRIRVCYLIKLLNLGLKFISYIFSLIKLSNILFFFVNFFLNISAFCKLLMDYPYS